MKKSNLMTPLSGCLISLAFAASSHAALTITTNTGANGVSGVVSRDPGITEEPGLDGTGSFPGLLNIKNTYSGVPATQSNPATTRKGYIRFDVSSLNFTVTTATLSLEAHVIGLNAGTTRTINVYGLIDGANDGWDSASMNWANAPANVTTSGSDFTAAATLLGIFTLVANDDNTPNTADPGPTFDFSSAVLTSFINADTNGLVTIMLSADNTGIPNDDGKNAAFATENTTINGTDPAVFRSAPTLTLIPEPSSALLGGLGALLLLRRRRA